MTDEMLDLARRNAVEAGVDNVEFLKGYLEDIPLPDGRIDVVISDCVINLAADKNEAIPTGCPRSGWVGGHRHPVLHPIRRRSATWPG